MEASTSENTRADAGKTRDTGYVPPRPNIEVKDGENGKDARTEDGSTETNVVSPELDTASTESPHKPEPDPSAWAARTATTEVDDNTNIDLQAMKLSLDIVDGLADGDELPTPTNSNTGSSDGASLADSLATLIGTLDCSKETVYDEHHADRLHCVLKRRAPQLARLYELRDLVSSSSS